MPRSTGQSSSSRGDIRLAPVTGDVVSRGRAGAKDSCCTPLAGGCGCRKDLGPMDDHEDPSPEDVERFSDVTLTCPSCGKEVHDEAELCYHCGGAFTAETKGPPVWIIITAVIMAIGLIFLAVR